MLFLTLSNAGMLFLEQKLIWNSYIVAKALSINKKVKLINKKKFAKGALNEESEIFIVHVAALEAALAKITIYSTQKA